MQPVSLFDLASQQAKWLAVRQSAVAGNIANVNTPDYKATDVQPFEKVLDGSRVAMKVTSGAHLAGGVGGSGVGAKDAGSGFSVLQSEASVVLENELLKGGEVRRAFELNTAIVKSFHRMLMMASRS